tara:strand:- start:262 stop:384 length:123 start_codon:yes stop_codon:yes gene_type:complete
VSGFAEKQGKEGKVGQKVEDFIEESREELKKQKKEFEGKR